MGPGHSYVPLSKQGDRKKSFSINNCGTNDVAFGMSQHNSQKHRANCLFEDSGEPEGDELRAS